MFIWYELSPEQFHDSILTEYGIFLNNGFYSIKENFIVIEICIVIWWCHIRIIRLPQQKCTNFYQVCKETWGLALLWWKTTPFCLVSFWHFFTYCCLLIVPIGNSTCLNSMFDAVEEGILYTIPANTLDHWSKPSFGVINGDCRTFYTSHYYKINSVFITCDRFFLNRWFFFCIWTDNFCIWTDNRRRKCEPLNVFA